MVALEADRTRQLDAFRTACAVSDSGQRDVVTVVGPDARSFLQSLVSQDLAPFGAGDTAQSLLLQPQGKLVASFRVTALDDETWVLDTDAGVGSLLAAGLARFKIRVRADIAERHDLVAVALRGPDSTAVATAVAKRDLASGPVHGDLETGLWLEAPSTFGNGVDWIGPAATARSIVADAVAAGAVEATPEAWTTARVELGVLVQGLDIDETTIAQEAELEHAAVSFTKGCFVGQELVCRIDSRGHVNRFVRRLELDGSDESVTLGTDVEYNGKVVGTVSSVAPWSRWALATIRREVPVGAEVAVGSGHAVVHERVPQEDLAGVPIPQE